MIETLKSLEPKGTIVTIPDETIQLHCDCYDTTIERLENHYMIEDNSDLLQVTTSNCCCSECAKYMGRIYSFTGKDKRFPMFPEWLRKTKCSHCLGISIYPFVYGFSIARYVEGDVIETSNKHYVDNRPQEDIDTYSRMIAEYEDEMRDRSIYPQLAEKLPDEAPKTYGAYRRMKKQKSKGYLKLVEAAKAVGIELPM